MRIKKLKVVAIGGGHGLGRVLSTLSFLGDQLTGIVTTTDNGGSTGKLRKRSSSIAWGDLRNCLTELVDPNSIPYQLFNFRFDGEDELGGHNLGNLILYGLGQIQSRPLDSIKVIRRLLRVKTRVYPMSEEPTDLLAFYPKRRCRVGELSVDDMPQMPESLLLAPTVKALPEAVKAIEEADLIIIGPGSFLTRLVPPLLMRDISKALSNTESQVIFIDNVVNENSPAGEIDLIERLEWLEANIGFMPINTIISPNKKLSSERFNILCERLASDKVAHYHDKVRLIDALEQCLENFS
jgi:uncharacterized cofD-like protein